MWRESRGRRRAWTNLITQDLAPAGRTWSVNLNFSYPACREGSVRLAVFAPAGLCGRAPPLAQPNVARYIRRAGLRGASGDTIPGALSILKGAVPDPVRGPGHTAPTYVRRFPGSILQRLSWLRASHAFTDPGRNQRCASAGGVRAPRRPGPGLAPPGVARHRRARAGSA